MIPESIISEVQRVTEIVDLVSVQVPLKRSGRSFKGLCPYHQEKTPSFHVDPVRQMFHCFGCGVGGTVFTWVMKQEGVTFPEAVRMLAERAGIRIAETGPVRDASRHEALLAANRWTSDQFRAFLKAGIGDEAKAYLKGRGFKGVTAAKYLLGYAPQAGQFVKAAESGGISLEALEEAGVLSHREDGGFYERFRHRVMFPIQDAQERLVGFGGRVLDDGEPKYLNTAQTPLFNKGRLLYGLAWARKMIASERRVLVMEGYTDCLMAHQCGIEWAVATLGTALTEDHVRLLGRYADTVVLLFDPDAAGQKAAARGLEVFARGGVEVRIAQLPGDDDPCEFLLARGAGPFLECLDKAQGVVPFRIGLARAAGEWDSPEGRTRVLRELIGWAGASPDPIRREVVLKEIVAASGLPEGLVQEEAGRVSGRAPAAGASFRPRRAAGASIDRLHRDLLRLLFEPAAAPRVAAEIGAEDFAGGRFERLAAKCFEILKAGGPLDAVAVSARVEEVAEGEALSEVLAVELEEGMTPEFLQRWIEESLHAFSRERARKSVESSRRKLMGCLNDPNDPQVDEELRRMQSELKKSVR